MSRARPALFTAPFFTMCAFSFTVFVSAFLLLPTAPYRILALGGDRGAAGLFLGLLTYASALSAPLTGALADRLGKRRVLLTASLFIAAFSLAYAAAPSVAWLLLIVPVHGVFWSGLLSASAAHMTDLLPESRRAEGIGYWGLASVLAIAVSPSLGFVLLRHGWATVCLAAAALNLAMAAIAGVLREAAPHARSSALPESGFIEWRVVATSLCLLLYSYGYGAITSFVALYADMNGVRPRGLYFVALALVIACTRPLSGPLADRVGHRRVFLPSLALIVLGLGVLAWSGARQALLLSALIFGSGFGTAYPVYAAYVMQQIPAWRRGAAFGGILAAFDIGIGSGSIATGLVADRLGFGVAFGVAAALASLAIPYFLFADERFLRQGLAAENV